MVEREIAVLFSGHLKVACSIHAGVFFYLACIFALCFFLVVFLDVPGWFYWGNRRRPVKNLFWVRVRFHAAKGSLSLSDWCLVVFVRSLGGTYLPDGEKQHHVLGFFPFFFWNLKCN